MYVKCGLVQFYLTVSSHHITFTSGHFNFYEIIQKTINFIIKMARNLFFKIRNGFSKINSSSTFYNT